MRFYVYTLPENRNKVVDIHQKAGGYDELIINTEILSQSDSPIEMRGFCYLDAYCSAEQDCLNHSNLDLTLYLVMVSFKCWKNAQ